MAEQMKTYDWDDEITNDGQESYESVLLPEGNYPFEVIKVEKAYYDGSDKLPPCHLAKVFIRVDGGDLGSSLCVENLYLCEKTEWKAAAFLRSVGLKKHGEPIAWRKLSDNAVGETGRCKIYVDTYKGKNGDEMKINKIDRFFDKEEQAPKKEFTKGKF